mmetsp:Transcript_2413/g.4765  ORF Transcript_2413/g.4765 Transcript_2413/m.4765 type:complete len:378 (+) Transcript_2413:104-1237(+)
MTTYGSEKVTENEALIQSSFRRLISSIEAEREKIRETWQRIDQERAGTARELERLRQDTEEWCYGERQKIDSEWKRLDKLRERMSVLWPEASENLEINCSGALFTLPKSALCSIEGSYLNHMFSDAFVQNIPRDAEGRFFLDFNPDCFALVVEYLQARRLRQDALPPPVPMEHQQNMDLLAEALRLKAFMPTNRFPHQHGTSLKIIGYSITSMHPGWQFVAAQYPLPMSGMSYFEIKVVSNPGADRGGLAIGVCGHKPTGPELHTVRIADVVLYNSNVGLIGDAVGPENVAKGISLSEGTLLGVKHDVSTHTLQWYYNRLSIGISSLKEKSLERMRVVYPVFGLMNQNQKIEVDFTSANCPGTISSAMADEDDLIIS